MATEFKDTSWGDEVVDASKLNQMSNNIRYVFERMPRLNYTAHGAGPKETGVRVLAGLAAVPALGDWQQVVTVYFGSYFTQGCRPVVVSQLAGYNVIRIFNKIRGIGMTHPDHRGFEAGLVVAEEVNNRTFQGASYLHWLAIGY